MARCALSSPRRRSAQDTATALAVNDERAPPPRLRLSPTPGLFESSVARITSGAGTQVTEPTRRSAAPAAQRCSDSTRSARSSSTFAWDPSMATPGYGRWVACMLPAPPFGSQFPMMACPAFPDLSKRNSTPRRLVAPHWASATHLPSLSECARSTPSCRGTKPSPKASILTTDDFGAVSHNRTHQKLIVSLAHRTAANMVATS